MVDKTGSQTDDNSYDDDFLETELYADYDLVYKDIKRRTKQQKAKSKKETRRRLEDYFDSKRFKEKVNDDWDSLLSE